VVCHASRSQTSEGRFEKGFLVEETSAGANFTAGLVHRYCGKGHALKITGLVFWASSGYYPNIRPTHLKPRILSVDKIDDVPV
jgi:hypothetical protein